MRVLVLVGGSETWHDCIAAGQAITEQLLEQGFQARLSQDAGMLLDQRRGRFEVVVHYGQEKRWTRQEQEALERFVDEGRGLVAVHCANVMGQPDHGLYEELVGSAFTGHEPFGTFTVSCQEHAVTRGIADFAVEDELYRLRWLGAPGRVLATATTGSAAAVPVAYVRDHGAGRVCYLSLGHDARAWRHPSFRLLVGQAVGWAGGSERAALAAAP